MSEKRREYEVVDMVQGGKVISRHFTIAEAEAEIKKLNRQNSTRGSVRFVARLHISFVSGD